MYLIIFYTLLDKEIKKLGSLQGKVLLFGGVYSNLQALEKLKTIAENQGIPPQNCISTGDVVGYCAQPQETVDLFRKWGVNNIAGNVEKQLAEGKEDCGCDFLEGSRCDSFSQLWYPYAKINLNPESISWMGTLPDNIQFEYHNKKITVVHGSFSNISEFIFKSTPWELKKRVFQETESDVIVAGHCGLPFNEFQEGKTWINPGVIGMPANDGSPKVWYAILDKDLEGGFKHFSLKYNHKKTHILMVKNKLPIEYARTILTGIWDNSEILPPLESGLQGFGINL